MKFLSCVCLGLLTCSVWGAEEEDEVAIEENQPKEVRAGEASDTEPRVYVDISKKAQQNAIKYNGLKAIAGLSYSKRKFRASVTNGSTFKQNDFNKPVLTVGLDYAEKIKQKFLIGVTFLADIGKNETKKGSWDDLNADYFSRRGASYAGQGNLTGELKPKAIVPEISLRGGYIFPKFKSAVFVKVGAVMLEVTYKYKAQDTEVASVKIRKFVPSIGLGGERRINKKLGVRLEASKCIAKTAKKNADLVNHEVKLDKLSVRLLGTYSLSDKSLISGR